MENQKMNDLVDRILPILSERDQMRTYLAVPGYCKDVFGVSYSDGEYLAQKLHQLKLAAFLRPDGDMRITTFGREIVAYGGWAKYLENQRITKQIADNEAEIARKEEKLEKMRAERERREERLENSQERISNKNLAEYQLRLDEINVKAAQKSANASWFGGIIGLFALIYSLYQGYVSKSQNEEITKLKTEVVRVDSIQKSLLRVQTQTKFLPDSLPKRK